MKNIICLANRLCRKMGISMLGFCVGLLGGYSLLAGEAPASKSAVEPAPEETNYNNWVELTTGGLVIHGDSAQFKEEHRISGDVFGGIEDMHLEKSLGKALLALDAHAIFDNGDYKVKLELSQPDLGYIRMGYTQFRTWYDGNGGYFPPVSNPSFPAGRFVAPQLLGYDNELALDRGSAWIELGLRKPNLPEITFRYEHTFRNGAKDSTEWASTGLTGSPGVAPNSSTRKIVPSFYDINEKRDIFTLDAKKTFGNTDLNLGMRYEHIDNDDSLNQHNNPGAIPAALANNVYNIPLTATDYFITQDNQVKSDLFSGHFSTETRFSDKLWLTSSYGYTSMSGDIGGDRINGPYNGSPYAQVFLINGFFVSNPNSSEFLNLGGGSQSGQHVGTLSLMWVPLESLTITPSFRVESDDTDAVSLFNTTVNQTTKTITIGKIKIPVISTLAGLSAKPTFFASHENILNAAQSLEVRYTGINDWVFYANGDWEEEHGNRSDFGPNSTILSMSSDSSRLRQKYTVGTNWYPLARLNLALQYYHQTEDFGQNFFWDDPVSGNQRLLNQAWSTDDVNCRVTLRPLANVSLVSRYDFQYTAIDSQWQSTAAANRFITPEGQSGTMENHMFTECVTWNPLDRMYIQGNASYVLNRTNTPGADATATPIVLNFSNDYWTAGCSVGFALDEKTNLQADYSYYRANDYVNNANFGMPYGSGATEHSVSASISRQITKNIRLMLKYGYYNYKDQTSGGFDNYDAHLVYSSLQIRF